MRVVNNSTSDAILAQIQTLSSRQAKLQNEVSTGQRVVQPEDDPASFSRIMGLDTEKSQLTQYLSNTSRALDVSQASYSGLQQIKSISDRAGELGTLGSGANSPDANQAYGQEVNQLIEQAVQLANSKFGSDYLYSGTAVSTAPITVTRNSAGDITAVTYAGNSSQNTMQVSESSSLAPGTTSSTNSGMADFINNMISLRDQLNTGTPTNMSTIQASLESSENTIVDALSEQGAVQTRINVNQQQLQSRSDAIDKQVSDEADVDLATTVVKLSQTSTAYEAALSSASKIMQTSLLDYL